MIRKLFAFGVCLALVVSALPAQAGISLAATRVIFDGKNKEAAIVIRNSDSDILAQSWLEGTEEVGEPPFAVTPALVKVAANQQQLLRLLYEGAGLPTDRESVFWLNVQEIPLSASQNSLQFAVRQRIKVFYRPAGLPGDANAAPLALKWQWVAGAKPVLRVSNPSLYHVSMVDLKMRDPGYPSMAREALMLAPGASAELPLDKLPAAGARLIFDTINDYGARVFYEVPLSPDHTGKVVERTS